MIDIDGPPCQGNCPNHGCIESIASGTALARDAALAAAEHPGLRAGPGGRAGGWSTGGLVTERARRRGSLSTTSWRPGRRLGAALSGLANIFDPDVMVIGGGVMAAGDLILDPAREEFAGRALPPQNRIPIRAAALGADAGMIGAALLAAEELAAGALADGRPPDGLPDPDRQHGRRLDARRATACARPTSSPARTPAAPGASSSASS